MTTYRNVGWAWLAAAWIVATGFGADARAESYQLDVSHTAVVFKIQHIQYSHTYGRFNDVQGSFALGDQPMFEFSVKTASIDSNFKKRDDHLRGPDFFNAKQFPMITFKSTKVETDGKNLAVTGDLSLHGVTQTVTIPLQKMGEGQDPWGQHRAGFSTTFTIKRSEFGMTNMLDLVGDDVSLMISFEGVRQ